jgi:immune inhibitor A
MTRQVTLPAGAVSASFKASYHIEPCWDYAYLQVSTNGTDFTNVHTSLSTDDNTNGQNQGEGITGISGTPLACDDDLSPTPTWVDGTADLSAYAGMSVWLRFRYWTDGAVVGDGFSVDNLAITGAALDGAETDPGWDYDGFFRTNGTVVTEFDNYYIAEYRTYTGYDRALKVGPYSFTDIPDENWVEHFEYQDGLLIWYWDTSQNDNNVGDHPGQGLLLPIDAHPKILHWSNGTTARPRIQSFDSTFGIWKVPPLTLHRGVYTLNSGWKVAKPIFNDDQNHWKSGDPGDAANDGRFQAEWASVRHPHTGTVIRVLRVYNNGLFMDVQVN